MKTFKEFCTQLDEAAWTKKAGQNKEGGLNEKGRKSYERENPWQRLESTNEEEGQSQKKILLCSDAWNEEKLTSKKTARDPDSRINKSLRKWDC